MAVPPPLAGLPPEKPATRFQAIVVRAPADVEPSSYHCAVAPDDVNAPVAVARRSVYACARSIAPKPQLLPGAPDTGEPSRAELQSNAFSSSGCHPLL